MSNELGKQSWWFEQSPHIFPTRATATATAHLRFLGAEKVCSNGYEIQRYFVSEVLNCVLLPVLLSFVLQLDLKSFFFFYFQYASGTRDKMREWDLLSDNLLKLRFPR